MSLPPLRLRARRRRGASLIEYALFLGLIASAALGAVVLLGECTSDMSERTGAIFAGDLAPPAVVGPGAPAFSILSSDCSGSLGAGESCSVVVEACAVGNGTWEARLEAVGAPGGVDLRAASTGFAPAFA